MAASAPASAGGARRARAWLVLRTGEREVRAVRRAGARAADRGRARASTAGSPARARHPRARARRGRVPAAPARRRPDAPDRRRAARPAHDRRDRQPLEVRRLLRRPASTRGGRPAACPTTRRWRSSAPPPADAAVRAGRQAGAAPRHLRDAPAGPARAAATPIPPRPGRRQPPTYWCPAAMPDADARASATRAPTTSRRATRSRRFDAALAHGVDMIEFDVLPEHRATETGELLLAHDCEDAAAPPLKLEEGLAHFARRRLRRHRAGRRPQAPRLRASAWSRRCARTGSIERTLVSTMDTGA